MKIPIAVIFLAPFLSLCYAQNDFSVQDGITKPALSLRCKEMHKERGEKVKMQQRLNALLQRNQGLVKKSPNAKEAVHARLKANELKIKNELHLTNLQIDKMEENIVRSGCPGISL
jgi:hypothetical protein